MPPFVQSVTRFASLATVIADAGIILLILLLLFRRQSDFLAFVARRAIWIGFAIALIGVATSLFYSEVAGFAPCLLCWWQRVFLYPQALVFAVGLWWRDKKVSSYSLALSIPGALLAIYHSYLQFGGSPLIPCSANATSCIQRYFLEFGYVTIPTMSLTAFGLIIVLMIASKIANRTSGE